MNYLKSLSMIALAAILAVSCKSPNEPVKVTGVSLNKSTLSLLVSTSEQLTAIVSPADAADKSVTWASSNPAVATVENGNVSAIAVGEATITATAGTKTATCAVKIKDGVRINGIIWAKYNVDMPNTFAATPESTGMFYQWNRKIGWSSTDPMVNSNGGTEWDISTPAGTEWTAANDPSPAGWRVPTFNELRTLHDAEKVRNEWTTQNGVNGRLFTDIATGNTLFLSAAGTRYISDGTLCYVGANGFYWSSTQDDSDYAYLLNFDSDYVYRNIVGIRSFGFCVRPVSE